MATILDVAALAGVSIGTVSRVMNNSAKVSEETRKRVLAAVAELGYSPSPSARALVTGRTAAVHVFARFLNRPAVFDRLRGILDTMGQSPHELVVANVTGEDELRDYLGTIDTPSGIILITVDIGAALLQRFRQNDVPVVAVDLPIPDTPSVFIDDVAGGRIATDHLLALGHERIAFIGDAETNDYRTKSSFDRRTGYMASLRAKGIEVEPRYMKQTPHSRADAAWAASELLDLDRPPTAIFASTDNQALGVLDSVWSRGMKVPDELSVIGFDDLDVAKYADLTSVRQPLYDSGREAARMILEWIETGVASPLERKLELELIRRGSTARLGCE